MSLLRRISQLSIIRITITALLCAVIVGTGQADQRLVFAQQIVIDINGLEADTAALDLPRRQQKSLNRRLNFTAYSLQQGIKKSQAGKENTAIRRFKFARFFINSYLRALSYRVKRGLMDSNVAEPLQHKARIFRNSITQLINGEFGNSAPVANAGLDQSVEYGQLVTLDGSGSSDPEGAMLSYQWTIISLPMGSRSILNNDQSITPTINPDLVGTYAIELVVNDGELTSDTDLVVINVSATNTQPVANAGIDQTGYIGDTINLDGSGSSDADGDQLSFIWSLLSIPAGSSAELDDDSAIKPSFIADTEGRYQAGLYVNDGQLDSAADSVTINIETPNTKPVADAGPDQSVLTNQQVRLDGSGSSDVDGDYLTWHWTLINRPQGSQASLNDELLVNPYFISDLEGQYVAQLVVNDSEDDSEADTVLINALTPNTRPVADAGADQSGYVGSLITLDGSASTDADDDPLSYSWSLLSIPEHSQAQLDNPVIENPAFVLDISGDYIAQLIVNDNQANSVPDTVSITTLNSRPVADASADQVITLGEVLRLAASGSFDADDDALSYQWSLLSQPDGSDLIMFEDQLEAPVLTPDDIGFYVFQLIVSDGQLDSLPASMTVQVNPVEALAITLDAPQDRLLTGQPTIDLIGQLSHMASLTLNDNPVAVQQDLSFSQSVNLQEGMNTLTLRATDAVGGETALVRQVTLDTTRPAIPQLDFIAVRLPDQNDRVTIIGEADSVEPLSETVIQNRRTGETVIVFADGTGAFSAKISGRQGDAYTVMVVDAAGNQSEIVETDDGSLPPDPASVAPPLDPTKTTSLFDATSFLFSSANPIQTGVAAGTIKPELSAVIRGRVLDRQNNPLPGVKITIKGHPEFGRTLSRADGMFDLVVNGGGQLIIDYAKDDYLPVQRYINTGWRDYFNVDDVVMIRLDPHVTPINLLSNEPMQTAQGSVVTDSDGTRQATVMFPQGTTATMILPDGSEQPLTRLNFRATEYTVGENGPKTMPAPLPATSGYTYAVKLSIDEAIAADATSVRFNQPVSFYVDNFLEFPVGEIVPIGYYDKAKSAWIPSENGKIIKLVGITDGKADISVNPDGVTLANQAELEALQITDVERTELANTYAVGSELWRAQLDHFTAVDCNWPYGPPPDSTGPMVAEASQNNTDCPNTVTGCVIEAENQVLGEEIAIAGTPYTLNYRSSRTAGYKPNRSLRIPISGDSLPGSLRGIELKIEIAGQVFTKRLPVLSNQIYYWEWDGLDSYGRELQSATANINIAYIYPVYYYGASAAGGGGGGGGGGSGAMNVAFARASTTGTVIGGRDIWDIRILRAWQRNIGTYIPDQAGLGGWTLNDHHSFFEKTLYKGDGAQIPADQITDVIDTVAGIGSAGFSGDGFLAREARISAPYGLAIAPDGSVYISDWGNRRIRKVDVDGLISTIAGSGVSGDAGDGGPATAATLREPMSMAIAGDGSLYVVDKGAHKVRRIGPDGIINTVAGNGQHGYSSDGGPATEASLNSPVSIALAADGSIYIADDRNHRVRRVGPDGIISTVAGTGQAGFSGDDGMAIYAKLNRPAGVAISREGDLYIADTINHRVRRIGVDGKITTVAGNGLATYTGDGGMAVDASLYSPAAVAVSPQGNLFISDKFNHRVRAIDARGIINTVAGNGQTVYAGDRGPAGDSALSSPNDMAFAPDGNLYIVDRGHNRIRQVSNVLPNFIGVGLTGFSTLSPSGQELYNFDRNSVHQKTIDPITQSAKMSFAYDDQGLLSTITDIHGNITRIERDAIQGPLRIISPDGQVTGLALDQQGYLSTLTNPLGDTYRMVYDEEGLLTAYTNPNAQTSVYAYDEQGRLVNDINPEGGGWTLQRDQLNDGHQVTMTTAEGRKTRYRVINISPNSDIRRTFAADGAITTRYANETGKETLTRPNGVVISNRQGPDPRFGMQSPINIETSVQTPDGLTSNTTRQRTVTQQSGELLSLTDSTRVNGRLSENSYDALSRTWTQTTAANRTGIIQINAKGQPIVSQVSGLEQVAYDYDSRGRLNLVTEGSGASERQTRLAFYQAGPMAGYLESITNAENQTTRFEYDALGRVTRQLMPDLREILYSYDANGNLTSLTPPGRPAHVYQYDGVDQANRYQPPALADITSPETVYNYNLDKQLIGITRPDGQVVNFKYGATTGKLDSMSTPTGSYLYRYYDASRQLTSITAPGKETIDYSYDGSLITNTTLRGTVAGSVDRVYDNAFRISSRSINGAHSINFAYDNDSLLTLAGSLSISRETQKAGLINGTALGNLATARTYNGFAELDSFDVSYGASSLFNTRYVRDRLGRITRKTETIQAETTATDYVYDPSGRLQSETTNGITISYTYDANGNRTHINGSAVGSYDDQDRLLSYAGTSYRYTDNGELLAKTEGSNTTQYQYDVLGNLRNVVIASAAKQSPTTIEYVIDGQNRRVGKKVDGTLVQGFLYKDQLNPIAELDGNNNIISRFVYGTRINVPDYMIRDGNTYRIISDHLGSPRLVVNIADGTVIQRIDYDTWGNVTSDTNPGFQPFGFAGGIYDQDTQLTRFGARDYDAWSGRWTSKDPIQFEGGDTNLYGFVANDLVNNMDINGLWSINVSAYAGIGGGVTVTYSEGILEVSGTIGVGIGGGANYDPSGGLTPIKTTCDGYFAHTTASASAGLGFGVAGGQYSLSAGSGNALTTPSGGDYISGSGSITLGNGAPVLGFSGGVYAGVTVGSQTSW